MLDEEAMQRLYSTFARGWPGIGLLVLRATAAITAFHFSGSALVLNWSLLTTVIEGAAALLLCAGLWTPIAGSMMAGVAVWTAFSRTGDPWPLILLAAVGVGLAMLGPGAWSIDALLFGRRRMIL
jgi:putative oxidoreductase